MDPNRDITDAFDDEKLKRTIAGSPDDPWRDPEAVFVDPKLKELEQQLSQAPLRGYHRRRLDELEERVEHGGELPKKKDRAGPAVAKPKPAKPAEPEVDPFAAPPGDDAWAKPAAQSAAAPKAVSAAAANAESLPRWRQPVADPELIDTARKVQQAHAQHAAPDAWDESTGLDAAADEPPPRGPARRARRSVRRRAPAPGLASYVPSLFAATLVMASATLTQAVLDGWYGDMVYRAIGATVVTGALWRRFQSTRVRAIAIGCVCHALAFATTARMEDEQARSAALLGLALVVGGSALLGVQRDEFAAPAA